MYAIVANGIQTIVKTQEQLDIIISLFPYPKFQRVSTEQEGREWILRHSRIDYSKEFKNYGETAKSGYAEVDYFIEGNNIYYNVKTERLGFIRVERADGVLMDSRPELLKIKVVNVALDNLKIAHHCIAIQRLLLLLGDYVDVTFNIPDMSVYLALTRYTGNNFVIKRTQELIRKRLGAVSFTIREGMTFNRNAFDDMFDL